MTLHRLWNHFDKFPYQEDATIEEWQWLIFRNYDKTIKILVALSKNLKCLLCGDCSLNYTTKGSLARHYRWEYNKFMIANWFIEHVLSKSPDEMDEAMRL